MAQKTTFRRKLGSLVIDGLWQGLAKASTLHPAADPARRNLERIADVHYGSGPHTRSRTLDIYRPIGAGQAKRPALLYVHGGGFRILSKDSHWIFGMKFAEVGFTVFNINYRLSREAPFPGGLQDTFEAYLWMLENAERYGADPTRVVVAGESAGANLITALTWSACVQRDEPWAKAIYERGVVPLAVLPACGLLQATQVDRLWADEKMAKFIRERLQVVSDEYLANTTAGNTDLADPLCLLESDIETARPLPPFFSAVGSRDPVGPDTHRLHAALQKRGITSEMRCYQGAGHAFHAFAGTKNGKACWRDTRSFLGRHVLNPSTAADAAPAK